MHEDIVGNYLIYMYMQILLSSAWASSDLVMSVVAFRIPGRLSLVKGDRYKSPMVVYIAADLCSFPSCSARMAVLAQAGLQVYTNRAAAS